MSRRKGEDEGKLLDVEGTKQNFWGWRMKMAELAGQGKQRWKTSRLAFSLSSCSTTFLETRSARSLLLCSFFSPHPLRLHSFLSLGKGNIFNFVLVFLRKGSRIPAAGKHAAHFLTASPSSGCPSNQKLRKKRDGQNFCPTYPLNFFRWCPFRHFWCWSWFTWIMSMFCPSHSWGWGWADDSWPRVLPFGFHGTLGYEHF